MAITLYTYIYIYILCELHFKFEMLTFSETWNPEGKKESINPKIIDGYFE